MKRLFDLLTAVQALMVLLVPAGLVALAVLLTSKGPVIYWSDRVGRYNKIFKMPKFRTMRIDTPTVATHLINQVIQGHQASMIINSTQGQWHAQLNRLH